MGKFDSIFLSLNNILQFEFAVEIKFADSLEDLEWALDDLHKLVLDRVNIRVDVLVGHIGVSVGAIYNVGENEQVDYAFILNFICRFRRVGEHAQEIVDDLEQVLLDAGDAAITSFAYTSF